ncbi:MAG: hypothetical protein C0594_12000 [Marinilabiliales bacterium]|nr:MAG: hypothetical protein C0594_12000 [Marinilabiliales bacterium]
MVFGPGAPGNLDRLIGLLDNKSFLPLGNIKNKRNFIYVDNLSRILIQVIKDNVSGLIIQIDGEPLSTTFLSEKILTYLQKNSKLMSVRLFIPLLRIVKPQLVNSLFDSLYVLDTHPVVSKIENDFVKFDDALKNTVAYYLKNK